MTDTSNTPPDANQTTPTDPSSTTTDPSSTTTDPSSAPAVGATGDTPAFAVGDKVQVESYNPWTGQTTSQTGEVVAYLQDPDVPDRVQIAWYSGVSGPIEVDGVTKYDAPTG